MKEAIMKLQTYKLFEDGEVLVCRDDVLKALEQEPCEDTKTGHWIKVTNGRGGHECDICHEYAPSYKNGDEYLTKFCPDCGAKMEEEAGNEP